MRPGADQVAQFYARVEDIPWWGEAVRISNETLACTPVAALPSAMRGRYE